MIPGYLDWEESHHKENIRKFIGSSIKIFRTKDKLSQSELGDRIERSANTISRWETGEVECGLYEIFCLSRIFNVPMAKFFPSNLEHPNDPLLAELLILVNSLPKKDQEEVLTYAEFRRNEYIHGKK